MYCQSCGTQVSSESAYCPNCGARIDQGRSASAGSYPAKSVQTEISEYNLPEKYRPLGAWAYFGYSLLFCIPIAGFILLIVFSCSSSNINRRNFARSYWCWLVIVGGIIAALITFGVFTASTLNSYSIRYR